MNLFLVLPVLLPFMIGITLLIFSPSRKWEKAISLLSTIGLWIYSIFLLIQVHELGIQVLYLANWRPPFGVVFVADRLSAIMLVLSMTISVCTLHYSMDGTEERHQSVHYFPFVHFLLAGVNGAFLTGDLFNLFVFYEVILITSYILVGLGSEKYQLRQTFKYIVINLVGSTLFLAGIGLLYGVTGSWNMADIARRVSLTQEPWLVSAISIIFLIVFSLKSAAFPLYFWLPDTYPVAPRGINVFLAGIMTKVGIYSLLRVFSLIFGSDYPLAHELLEIIAGFTMIMGVLGALCQWELRRLLSFHIISQIGYLLMGLALFTPLSLAGAIFFMIHIVVVKSSLFLMSGIIERISGTTQLKEVNGLMNRFPFVSLLFIISAFGIAGVPPFSGFVAKFILVKSGLDSHHYLIVACALLTSFLTLYSMIKIWSTVFWGKLQGKFLDRGYPRLHYKELLIAPAFLTIMVISIGLFAEPIFKLSKSAAGELLNPSIYIHAVFSRSEMGR